MTDYDADVAFLGEWGRFQQQVIFALCLSFVPNGFTALSIVFLADTPSHRCSIPAHVNLTDAWRNSSVPLEEEHHSGAWVPSKCSRYRLSELVSFSQRGLLPGLDVNLSSVATEGCLDGWDYDRSVYISTITTEWDLVCDDGWKKPLTPSIFYFGVFMGSFISGQLSDRYGRKIVLLVNMAVQMCFTFFQYFSPSWAVFCALFFFVGVGQISNHTAAYVLGAEILGPGARTVFCTALSSLAFSVGYMLLPVLAFFVRDWRMLLIGLAAPGLSCVPLWWYIPESPRWLLSQGRVAEAEAIIRKAAKQNKKEAPPVIFESVQMDLTDKVSSTDVQPEQGKALNICDLLRTRNIRHITVTLWVVWNTLTIAYFALSLNTSNLHGDSYVNCFVSAVVEIPAYALCWVMFRWWSRRLSLFSTLFSGALFLFLIQLLPADLIHVATAFEMIGKFAVTAAFSIAYAYTTELYPTGLRNTALGTCSMASRIGSIVAPYFIYLRSYSMSLPYILMGCLTLLSGLLSLLLPESHGKSLPDTIAHMQRFPGCRQKKPYTLTHTEEKDDVTERKCPNAS
ncbi:uncharacterized protein V6R79_026438 [Siganus canaliculatus]